MSAMGALKAARETQVKVSPWRWHVLITFSLFSCTQCLVWFTFSSVDLALVQDYYDSLNGTRMTRFQISLLLNWGPIIGICFAPIQIWMMTRPAGLRRATRLGAMLVFACTVVRAIPLWVHTPPWLCLTLMHIAQALNAAAGPLAMGTESNLSVVWFPETERTTATAVAVTSNAVGTTVGFLLGPALAPSASKLPHLLTIEIAIAAVPLALSLFNFPPRPETPPSAAAAALIARQSANAAAAAAALPSASSATPSEQRVGRLQPRLPGALVNYGSGVRANVVTGGQDGLSSRTNDFQDGMEEGGVVAQTCWEGVVSAVGERSFVLLVLAAGIHAGVNTAWQSLLNDMLNPKGFSDNSIGMLGFLNGLAGNVSSVLVGKFSDAVMKKRFKTTILALLLIELSVLVVFSLMLQLGPNDDGLIPSSTLALRATIIALGVLQTPTSPLLYELCAEITFPTPESTSAGILAAVWNTASLIVIGLSPFISSTAINPATCIALVIVLAIVCASREAYRRPADDARQTVAPASSPLLVNG